MFVKGLLGSATAGSSGAQMVSGLICAAVRSSIQVLEMGITVAKGTAGTANNTTTTATTSDLAIYYRKPGGAPVKLAGMVFHAL